MIQTASTLKKSMLEALIAEDGLLDGCFIGLYTNAITLTDETTVADLTEPTTVDGYARQAVVWGDVSTHGDGYKTVAETLQFAGDAAHPTTIKGYFCADAATTGNLRFAEELPEEVNLSSDDDACTIVAEVTTDDDALKGEATSL